MQLIATFALRCPTILQFNQSISASRMTPELVEQNTTEKTAAAQNTVHTENIFWYGQEGVLPPYMEES
ncbi:hypothetical protein POUND7_008366 [Theobroma cacao]